MNNFPIKIHFVSCDSVVELVEENTPKNNRGKKETVTMQTAKYRYTYISESKTKTPSKKIGTTVDYTLEYLNRLNNFELIKF